MKKYHWVSMIMLLVFCLILSSPGANSNAAPVGSVSPAETPTPSVFPCGADAGPAALYVPGEVIIKLRTGCQIAVVGDHAFAPHRVPFWRAAGCRWPPLPDVFRITFLK
jgi:hypothetical protein